MTRKKPLQARKRPTQRRAEETVRILLEATAWVLVESGYSKASTNRIAKRAGVSIGSLYQYFPNKDALILALLERHIDAQVEILTSRLQETDWSVHSLPGKVRALIDALVHSHRENTDLSRVLFEQIPRTGELNRVRMWTERSANLIKAVLIAHSEELQTRDPAIAAYLLVHTFEGIISHTVMYRADLLENPIFVDEMCALVLGYIAPPEV